MEVDGRLTLVVGLLGGVGVMWVVGRAEAGMDEVTSGKTEELTGVEAAVPDTKAGTDEACDDVGFVKSGEWDTELGGGVCCGVEPPDIAVDVRGKVMEEDGKAAEV